MTRDEIMALANQTAGQHWMDEAHIQRFAALVAAAERERVMQIVQSMKANLEAKFEQAYMEGAMAGAAAEREACARVCDELIADTPDNDPDSDAIGACAIAIRARKDKQ